MPLAQAMQSVSLSDAVSGVRLLGEDRAGLTIKVEIGKIDFVPVSTPEGTFILAKTDGLTRSFRVGEPNLPVANKLISIPFGCKLDAQVVDYEIQEVSLTDLGLKEPLMPVQPSISKSDDPASIPFEFNRDIYAMSGYYTLPLLETQIAGTMRAIQLGAVTVSPVQYNPAENKLKVYKSVTVQVTYSNPDWVMTESIKARYYSPYFEPIYGQILNYQDAVSEVQDDLVKYPVKYVIISDRMFESQLQPFVAWKTKKGFKVITAYTDVIGTSNTAIKNYIHDLYDAATPEDPAPSFVLLVGDAQQIPPFNGSAGSHVTDLRFCEFTGDNFPEIYYGRFSAQDSSQLQPQIDKTLEYEQYLMPDPSYLGEVTLVSGVDNMYASTYGNGQLCYGTNYYFNVAHGINPNVWLYPASGQSGASSAIIQTIDDGIGLYNYTAHCSHSGHSTPAFTTIHIPNLTNYHKYLLGIGNCCEANTFGAEYGTPCFGEAFLQVPEKGGIGYIGGSNSTYWDEDYWWAVGYGPIVPTGPTYEETGLGAFDGLFHDHGEPVSKHYVTNDAIVFAGNLAVSESNSDKKAYYWEIYHLMGDPSVSTYLGVPIQNNISHPVSIFIAATSITVQADPGSYVGISEAGVLHGGGYVDSTGAAEITLIPFQYPGTADIVVTAQNRIPYISTVNIVILEGPYVIYDGHVVVDVAGNSDGLVNCGETISLDMQVKNVGADAASDVNAILSTDDPYITIIDSSENYGAIPGNNGTANATGAFSFDVFGSVPDGHMIPFQLTVSDSENPDSLWISSFSIQAHSPNMSFISVMVDDASGDNDSFLDPGETGELVIMLGNNGSADAISLQAALSTEDPNISIADAQGSFGNINADDSGDNASDIFIISAEPFCPLGHQANFQLTVSSVSGCTSVVDFNLTVGQRVAFYRDDFLFNLGWSGLGGQGEWAMGRAGGGKGGSGAGDPANDHTAKGDNRVLGNDLSPDDGTYDNDIDSAFWVISPIINCSEFTSVQMTYYHWLGIESNSYDHALLQAFDGADWVTLFENGAAVNESSWNISSHNLSPYADGNPDFRLRFGIGPTDISVQYCGWNIDDIEIKGYGTATGTVSKMQLVPQSFADTVRQGKLAFDTIRISNLGDATLMMRFESAYDWLVFDSAQQNIAPGDSLIFPVTIYPQSLPVGNQSAAVLYISNDTLNASGNITFDVTVLSPYECGDVNWDDALNILDVAYLINYLYRGGPGPVWPQAADPDSSGSINILDVSYLIEFLYKQGPAPNCP